jgi:predicted nucleotidyltransferase component of viral defense system
MATRSFELRELFHLLFLRYLAQRLVGRLYALKGGICLRFFHRSQRLSEDIDLDVSSQVAVKTLQNAVDTVLEARSLRSALAPLGLTALEATRPKQTETVQRWKVALIVGETRLPTKIEFSRRPQRIPFETGIPDREVLNHYRQPGFAAQYYGAVSMTVQKILALASPSRHAVRDLFDLHHLTTFLKVNPGQTAANLDQGILRSVSDKVKGFSYGDFAEEVLPYLAAELVSLYSDPAAFERLKSETLEVLKRMQR